MLTHIDLFSGIGGFALAAGWAGFRTVVFCEIDEFCQEVLKARFDAPLIPDIRDFDGSRFRGATLLTGGFPCQPFSVAGKRRGKEDDRHLWPEMLRVISEAKPTWVLGENVAGIVNMELEQVCADLEGEGYEVQPVIIPACAVNAPHRRDRVWIIAHAQNPNWRTTTEKNERRWWIEETGGPISGDWDIPWIEVATRLCRVDDGLPPWVHSRRVARLKALGNAIVPQVAYQILKGIAEIENAKI